MKIGEWEIFSVTAGMFRLDGGAMFGVVPKNLWARVAPPDEKNRISMAMRTLVVKGYGKTILVDTGAGTGYGEKFEKIYAVDTTVSVGEGLKSIGVSPEDITDVIITHLHFDHGGGAAVPRDKGWRLAFPNAVHHVQQAQWEHALSPNPRDQASYFNERIELLGKTGALELHNGEWNAAPGLDVPVFDGHTPGQQLPLLSDGNTTLLYCGDLIPTAAHLPAPYVMAYDLQPVLSMTEKTEILEEVAKKGWLLFFEHDPEVAACGVDFDGKRFTATAPVSI